MKERNIRNERGPRRDREHYKREEKHPEDNKNYHNSRENRSRIEKTELYHFKSERHERSVYKVNRKEKCPFLVRIFYAVNDENNYQTTEDLPLAREIHLHLWMDSTLREISELLRAHLPSVRTKQRFVYSKLITKPQSKELMKFQMGVAYMHKRMDKADERTLYSCKYSIGDYIDVSINYK